MISVNLKLSMNRLIINTANDKLFVVLQLEDNVFCKISESKMHHNETMLPLIDELLKENNAQIKDVQEFGVVIGPGSFTGIRVGIATIKAFRDSLGVVAKGINNLDYLFKLSKKANKDIDTVAIKGSKDSYFVAKYINDIVYKYDRNLTLDELKSVANLSKIGVFNEDENLDFVKVVDDAKTLIDCFKDSNDKDLIPVYYQLSQAENEKFKRAAIKVEVANIEDCEQILEIEQNSISYNTLKIEDIKTALTDENYKTFKVLLNDEIVGFVILQISDEVNIVSIAIKKEFRNIGLATRLLKTVEDFAKEINVNNISLEVSYKNVRAYLLYSKLGFIKRRIRKNYYQDGSNCIEMIKTI